MWKQFRETIVWSADGALSTSALAAWARVGGPGADWNETEIETEAAMTTTVNAGYSSSSAAMDTAPARGVKSTEEVRHEDTSIADFFPLELRRLTHER